MSHSTLDARAAETVGRLWGTNVALGKIELGTMLRSGAAKDLSSQGISFEQLDLSRWVARADDLHTTFLAAMQQLHAADTLGGAADSDPPHDVQLSLQAWRRGYEIPMYATSANYLGWLFLAGTESDHSDSGTVSILDPRAGSNMSAVPGLPWGRSLTVRPTPGTLAVVPGWLTTSVLPLEQHQVIVAVVATSVSAPAISNTTEGERKG